MSDCQSTFSLGREELVFVKKETNCNTLVVPAATDVVMVTSGLEPAFAPERLDDEQKRDTMSHEAAITGRATPGTWTLNAYLKPSGGATTEPEIHALLEAGLGVDVVDATDRLRYALGTTFDTLSIWRKVGHTVYAFGGCIVQKYQFDIAGEDFARVQISGQFMQRYFAGYSAADGAVVGDATTVDVTEGTGGRFSVGAYIQLGTDTNTGAGYRITEITADKLKISPGAATGCSSADIIRGLYPTTYTEVGDPVHGKVGQATLNGSSWNILTAQVIVNTGLVLYDNIKNNSLYASAYGAPGRRDVETTITAYADYANTEFHDRLDDNTQSAIIVPAGSTVPNIVTLYVPQFEIYEDPTPAGEDEMVQTFSGRGVATTTHNDEFKLIYGKAADA